MKSTLFDRARRHKGILLGLLLVATGAWAAVNGPRGLKVLLEKREEIKRLQEENAALEAENARRRERLHRLEENHAEQQLEIRKQLHLQRGNETTFLLADPAAPDPAKPAESTPGPAK